MLDEMRPGNERNRDLILRRTSREMAAGEYRASHAEAAQTLADITREPSTLVRGHGLMPEGVTGCC